MQDPKTFRERFAESGWRVLERALAEARRTGLNYVSLEHLISALAEVESDLFDAVMLDLSVDAREVRALLSRRGASGLQHAGAGIRIAPDVNSYLKRAWRRSHYYRHEGIEATDILLALAEDKRGLFVEMLRGFGADPDLVAFTVHKRVAGVQTARFGDMKAVFMRLPSRPEEAKFDYAEGDTVRIKSGPFASFTGKVEQVLREAAQLKVAVNIFGQPAALELRFVDVEKLKFAE